MNKAPEYRVGVGASSILMIFIILSLTTVSVLAFASARADLTLTAKQHAQMTAYYEAEAQAQRLLSDIDAALLQAQRQGEDPAEALTALDSRIIMEADGIVSIALPVGDTQVLLLRLTTGQQDSAARYTVLSHYVSNIEDWQPDMSVNLASPDEQP